LKEENCWESEKEVYLKVVVDGERCNLVKEMIALIGRFVVNVG
jgi:hypothetical protein